jgi:hypothetical protein
MHRSLSRTLIIGALAVLLAALGACSALRVGYSQAPQLVLWWLDSYVDLDDNQTAKARDAIRAWFRWHRTTQLADLAALLARLQAELAQPVTPAQMCRLSDEVQARLDTAFEQAAPPAVELARTLAPQQIAHIERRYAKNNAEYRRDFLQEPTEERFRQQVKRVVERAEFMYGRLDDAQRERIAQWVGDSPFDPQAWYVERQRRQQEILQVLRRLSTEAVPQDEALASMRRLVDHTWRSPRDGYRGYQQRLAQYNCAFAAQVHNQTTSEQRRHAVARLKGWEDDLRALANGS